MRTLPVFALVDVPIARNGALATLPVIGLHAGTYIVRCTDGSHFRSTRLQIARWNGS